MPRKAAARARPKPGIRRNAQPDTEGIETSRRNCEACLVACRNAQPDTKCKKGRVPHLGGMALDLALLSGCFMRRGVEAEALVSQPAVLCIYITPGKMWSLLVFLDFGAFLL